MAASYMNYYTAYEVVTLDGAGKGVCTHNLYTRTGIAKAKQKVTLTPVDVANLVPPAIDETAVPQTDNAVAIVGTIGAKVKVWVQAVHSLQQ